jgi:signal transduction histidine kinase
MHWLALTPPCSNEGVESSIGDPTMSQLAVVSTNPAMGYLPGAQAAHDLRNLLATVGLHLETLQRLCGPSGTKASDAAHALLTRGAAMCNYALDRGPGPDGRPRRRGVDLIGVARQVADLLTPIAPKGFTFNIAQNAAESGLADPDEVFRILFNLMSNAVAVANRKSSTLKIVTIDIGSEASMVTIRIADDGPGLPASVRAGLFGTQSRKSGTPRHGYGLAIARELAERNGGTLALTPAAKGAAFALQLPALLSVVTPKETLGRRAMVL